MNRANRALVVGIVCAFGLWGCAKGPGNNGSATVDKMKVMELKINKLEEDFRAAASARDQVKQELAAAEEQRTHLQKEVAATVKDRDDLRKQVATRTGERDALQVQFEQFRQAIRDVLGQAEANAVRLANPPVTAANEKPVSGKS
jgi:septal ring factor EnvC (AmiA/AmiB activator)